MRSFLLVRYEVLRRSDSIAENIDRCVKNVKVALHDKALVKSFGDYPLAFT